MFRFSCEKCGHRLKADEKFVGRTVKCPRCANRMKIPAKDSRLAEPDVAAAPERAAALEQVAAPAKSAEALRPEAASPTKPAPRRVRRAVQRPAPLPAGYFHCPKCQQPLGTTARIGGRWARCKSCGKIADIPPELLEEAPTVETAPVASQAAAALPKAQSAAVAAPVPVKSDLAIDKFLPPHYELLPELPDHDLPEFRKSTEQAEPDDDCAPPSLEGGYGYQLMLSPRKRHFYFFVCFLLFVYCVTNVGQAVMRVRAVGELRAGQTPEWMQSLTPPPPTLGDEEVPVRAKVRRAASEAPDEDMVSKWLLYGVGFLFLCLAVGNAFSGVALVAGKRDWVAAWVFWIAIAAIVLECLDLSLTRTGYLTTIKPLAWAVNILAVCGVVSR